jgi:hypothetical protein
MYILDYISKYYQKGDNIIVVGDLTPYEFLKFKEIINHINPSVEILISDYYLSFDALRSVVGDELIEKLVPIKTYKTTYGCHMTEKCLANKIIMTSLSNMKKSFSTNL